MPSNVSVERKRILQAYGAKVIYTDPGEGSDGAIRKAHEMWRKSLTNTSTRTSIPMKPIGWLIIARPANEIWQQTGGQLTHFVAILGTTGTFIGTTRRLKELNPEVQCISLQPDSAFHGIEGAKHLATAIVPGIYDSSLADRDLPITTEAAHVMVRRLAREEGAAGGHLGRCGDGGLS